MAWLVRKGAYTRPYSVGQIPNIYVSTCCERSALPPATFSIRHSQSYRNFNKKKNIHFYTSLASPTLFLLLLLCVGPRITHNNNKRKRVGDARLLLHSSRTNWHGHVTTPNQESLITSILFQEHWSIMSIRCAEAFFQHFIQLVNFRIWSYSWAWTTTSVITAALFQILAIGLLFSLPLNIPGALDIICIEIYCTSELTACGQDNQTQKCIYKCWQEYWDQTRRHRNMKFKTAPFNALLVSVTLFSETSWAASTREIVQFCIRYLTPAEQLTSLQLAEKISFQELEGTVESAWIQSSL